MKDSQLRAHVVVKTSNLVISRCHYAEDLKNIWLNPCYTSSTIIYDLLASDNYHCFVALLLPSLWLFLKLPKESDRPQLHEPQS